MKIKQDEIHPQMLLGEDGQCVAMCTSIASAEAIIASFNARSVMVKALRFAHAMLHGEDAKVIQEALDQSGIK